MMVRERDKFTCQDCGDVRRPEEVHEYNEKLTGLKGRIKLFDIHHINGLCGKNSKGYDSTKDMSGLITLCHRCHYNRPEHRVHSLEYRQKISLAKRGPNYKTPEEKKKIMQWRKNKGL